MLKNCREIIRRLERGGFVLVSVRGPHHKFYNALTRRTVIVAHPNKDTALGTVREIYRQVGWEKD